MPPRRPARPATPPEPPEPVEATLRALEPVLPAPPEQLIGPEQLSHELHVADVGDGELPHFLREQRPAKSPERLQAEAHAAQEKRGEAAWKKLDAEGGKLSPQEFADMCRFIDPEGRAEPTRGRYR
jgi:hypothetical protein